MFHGYHSNINNAANRAASSARASASEARSSVNELKQDIERLLMITEALWEFMKTEQGYTDEDLIKKVAEIDLKDGRLDGRVATSEPIKCLKCKRPVNKKRPVCIYCGAAVVQQPFDR